MTVQNRTVLITGGARGLGREMALALADAGARVCITGRRDSTALRDTATQLGAHGHSLIADVSDPEQAQQSVEDAAQAIGPIDVLINNAGVGMRLISETFNTESTKFWQADPDAWQQIVQTNVNGPFLMTRAVVPGMIARGFGKIINISTSDQTMVRRGYAPYGPSKAFLEAASRIWAQDLAGTGVDVNVLLPGGAADTDLLPPSADKKGADGNLLSPDIMRAPIVWLASDASNGHTGERYIARLWDDPDAARDPGTAKPKIM
ncbi:SDR family NAD(P)-dependent oxidoreductase [Oceaniglobus ichthyenteri]|uniref:SDR family NAD(P)-dependent oxidoreductase n=1 Tax=Oceaniglobus ichthyenteri TaxID=2136177 RepID=UPI000D3B3851|nr:SDR family oxidoreductase [Oceaniglobus ichthyenteri]